MTLRSITQAGVYPAMQNAVNGGPPTGIDLTATGVSSGDSQGSYLVPTDFIIITKADGTNKGVTLPDPAKLGLSLGDSYFIGNAQSGQTLDVFPPTGGKIDAASANAAATLAQGTTGTFYVVSAAAGASTWLLDGGS